MLSGCKAVMSTWLFNMDVDGGVREMNAGEQGEGLAMVSEDERE